MTARIASSGDAARASSCPPTPMSQVAAACRACACSSARFEPTGLVNDFAHVLSAESIDLMTRIAGDVRTKSRGEIAIVTLPDLEGRDVSDVALQIGREWKVGKIGDPGDATRNAGAVILLVPKETSKDGRGHCWVATGQGTEGFIRDADAGDICRAATPAFMEKDYSSGLAQVTLHTAQRFATEYNFQLDTAFREPEQYQDTGESSGGFPPRLLLILFIVIFMLISRLSSRRRGRRNGCGGGVPIIIPGGGQSAAVAGSEVEDSAVVAAASAALVVVEGSVAAVVGPSW